MIPNHGAQRYQLNMLDCQTKLVKGEIEKQFDWRRSLRKTPNNLPPKRYLAALLMNADREDKARNVDLLPFESANLG